MARRLAWVGRHSLILPGSGAAAGSWRYDFGAFLNLLKNRLQKIQEGPRKR